MVRRTTSIRNIYYFRVVFTIFFFFVLTINLYFILLKEMFIYSNHYLIVSILTREDYKDYLTKLKERKYSEPHECLDKTSFIEPDYIDLAIYEFESRNLYRYTKDYNYKEYEDPIDHRERVKYFAEYQENIIDHELYSYIFIHDHLHRSAVCDPFYSPHLTGTFRFYPNYDNLNDETIEKKLWDINYRESIVMDENEASLLYPRTYDNKSEDLKKARRFPKLNHLSYYLNEKTGEDSCEYLTSMEYVKEDMNFIVSHFKSLELDSMDIEYWNEPLFVFPLIREMHFHRSKKDCFSDLYTSPVNDDWFRISEFDPSKYYYT
jgi:hypothetical protein